MSLTALKVPELRKLAEDNAVDIDGIKSKDEIIAALKESGVDEEFLGIIKPVKPVTDADRTIVIKMTRGNFSFNIATPTKTFTFTREHPFAVVSPDEADWILEEEGFQIASPKEAREFYG
jgi:hypothetical protein